MYNDISLSDVHVWSFELSAPSRIIAGLKGILSHDELASAAHFHFEQHQQSYLLARGILRTLVGLYLGRSAKLIEFVYGAYGKPSLATTTPSALQFNLAHSGRIAVYAFTIAKEIGIDIEQIRPLDDWYQIANRYFTTEECSELASLSPEHVVEAFFNCWTRKEAYLKAMGRGLSLPLDGFRVSVLPWQPCRIEQLSGKEDEVRRWSLHAFRPAPGYVGALAIRDPDKKPEFFPYTTAGDFLLRLTLQDIE